MGGTIRVRLFATARQAVGVGELVVPVAQGGMRARELVERLAASHPQMARTLRASRFLRNDRYLTDLEAKLHAGDEFSVHPPYGGG